MGRFRLQILAVLLLVALLPAVPAALTVHALLDRSFDPRVQAVLAEGAQAGLSNSREWLEAEERLFAARIEGGAALDSLSAADRDLLRASPEAAAVFARGAQATSSVEKGALVIEPTRLIVNGRSMLVAASRAADGRLRWWRSDLPPGLEARSGAIGASLRLLQGLRSQRDAVVRSLVLTFVVIYGTILVLVLGLGWFLARRLTRPLEALAAGMDRVAEGDLSTQVPVESGSPVSRLLQHFNQAITRLSAQQEELLRLEKAAAWRDIARRLAHEIKNPLTPIQLAAQELRDRCRVESDASRELLREGTTIIEEEVARLRSLVDEFARFARLPEPAPRRTPAIDLLRDIAALYRDDQVRVSEERAGFDAHCDPEEIHRVWVNLVENALHARSVTGSTEPIVVSAERRADGWTLLHTLDRGPGVPAADRRRIFEPNVSGRPGGMGLGLAIVLAIVQAHRGTIEVSDRPGGGAVFTVALPPEEVK